MTPPLLATWPKSFQRDAARSGIGGKSSSQSHVTSYRDVRGHAHLALSAAALGWLVTWLGHTLVAWPASGMIRGRVMHLVVFDWSPPMLRPYPFLTLWMIDLASYPPIAAAYVLAGWIVGRLYPRHAGAVVAFAAVVLIEQFIRSMAIALTPITTMSGERGFPHPVTFVVAYSVMPLLGVLAGGLSGLGRRRPASTS
jgi:hypothetical protein